MDFGKSSVREESACKNTFWATQNVTVVKLHKIMIEGPGTMFSSSGGTQVDVCPFVFLSISINFCSPLLKCKILEGWVSSIFTTISPVSSTGRHSNIF